MGRSRGILERWDRLGETDHQEDGHSIEVSIWDRFVLWRLYAIHICGVCTRSRFFGVCSQFTVLGIVFGVCTQFNSRWWLDHGKHMRVGLRRKDEQDDFQGERERFRRASW